MLSFLEALSVGMVVNAFGHANSLQFDTFSSKLKRLLATPIFGLHKRLAQFDYLTFFDKIGGVADIKPVPDIWTLSARSRAWSA